MPAERRDPAFRVSFGKMGSRGEMMKAPVNLQDLRRRIYAPAKADSAGRGGVGGLNPSRKRSPSDRSHNPGHETKRKA